MYYPGRLGKAPAGRRLQSRLPIGRRFYPCQQGAPGKGWLERYFAGQTNLVLLHIDEHKLTAPFTYELSPSVNEEFPHIYGPMNLDAILNVEDL